MPTPGYRTPLAALTCLALALTGCSDDAERPPPSAETTAATPTATPEPTYTVEQVKKLLYKASDLGKNWTSAPLPEAFEERKLRGCSDSRISLTGSPEIRAQKFGAPRFRFEGANYAQIVAVYSTPEQAASSMEKIREALIKCPPSQKVPQKRLPNNRIFYQHDDTWKLTEGEIAGWKHIRGFEKSVYPPSLSVTNAFYNSIDYAQRGNIVFSSMYWKRTSPKDSGDPVAKEATKVLTEQLKRFE